MKMRIGIIVLCFMIAVIGFNLACSCGLKEGFEAATEWKINGRVPWEGSYSVPQPAHEPSSMLLFENNKSSPECCKASSYSSNGGCVCTTPEQLQFLNQRGGNRTVEDGF